MEVSTNMDFVLIKVNTVREWIFFSIERRFEFKDELCSLSQYTLSVLVSVCVVSSDTQL